MRQIALLIDAENTSPNSLWQIFHHLQPLGQLYIRRAYGDWSQPNLGSAWRESALEYGLRCEHQFRVNGKGTSDGALMMDALQLLYTANPKPELFAIASSDCDFVRLALLLRESGCTVIGFGEQKTLPAFINACSQFVYIGKDKNKAETSPVPTPINNDADLIKLICKLITNMANKDGWVKFTALIVALQGAQPDLYSYSDIWTLIKKSKLFETGQCLADDGLTALHVRNKLEKTDVAITTALDVKAKALPADAVKSSENAKVLPTAAVKSPESVKAITTLEPKLRAQLVTLLRKVIQENCEENGWTSLSVVGSAARKEQANFSSSLYGCATLSKLLDSLKEFHRNGQQVRIMSGLGDD